MSVYLPVPSRSLLELSDFASLARRWRCAASADALLLECGSEALSQYGEGQLGGCSNSSFHAPPRASTSIACEGEGCFALELFSKNGALGVHRRVDLRRGADFATMGVFMGDGCRGDEDACDCKFAANEVSAAFVDAETQCDIFESDFECAPGEPCLCLTSTAPTRASSATAAATSSFSERAPARSR